MSQPFQIPSGIRRRLRKGGLVGLAVLGCAVAAPAASQASSWHTYSTTVPGSGTTYLSYINVEAVNVLSSLTPPLWTGLQSPSGVWSWDTDWSLFNNVYVQIAIGNGRAAVVNWAAPSAGIQYSLLF